jgi:hypothetical protein
MDVVADVSKAKNANTHEPLSRAHEAPVRGGIGNLNVETVNKNPVLPTDRKWAIRFGAGETVTVVLGMRDYGRGCLSAYVAELVASRLGLPFRRVRVYYSATLPAVSQTPRIPGILLHGSQPGSVAAAVGAIICEMCGFVIEKGRLASAAVAGVGAADVDFDMSAGCFFARNTGWSGRTLEIAKIARESSSVSNGKNGGHARKPNPEAHTGFHARHAAMSTGSASRDAVRDDRVHVADGKMPPDRASNGAVGATAV